MIRVKSGTVGIRAKNGAVVTKTSKDGPFSLSDEDEARLVSRGKAAYVGRGGEMGQEPCSRGPKPAYNADMNASDLKGLMAAAGLKVNARMTRAGMVAALDECYGAEGPGDPEDGDDGGPPPVVSAGEPVP